MSAIARKKVQVLLPVPFDHPFTYEVPDNLMVQVGAYVLVSFGSRLIGGVVWGWDEGEDVPKNRALKPILEKFSWPLVSDELRQFLEKVSAYYMAPLGMVLKMVMPEASLFKPHKIIARAPESSSPLHYRPVVLSDKQKQCVSFLKSNLGIFHTVLLDGTTGSGKTEVYWEVMHALYENGQQSLVLLPEIALSTQWVQRFEQRFGVLPVLWHSSLTPRQRRVNWELIASGDALVVVGARSALFLPYENLGLIVVDEEHDQGYKQESGVFYQARDMAVLRASIERCLVVLASATPSLETIANVEQGRYLRCELPERYGRAQFPNVTLVDRRAQEGALAPGSQWITKPLYEAIKDNLSREHQTLLFLNRRGYAPLLLCRGCGDRLNCPNCHAWLVYHKHKSRAECHYCGYNLRVPKACHTCDREAPWVPCGPGVERVMEEVGTLFPEARLLMMTSDTMVSAKQFLSAFQKIENKEVDIIVGTQMMAKGHHFPAITLVGILDGDLNLAGGDLRIAERTYQLLHQVGGRSGRGEKKGQVIIQSHMSDHSLMIALATENRDAFLGLEKEGRKVWGFPPYGRLVSVIVSGRQSLQTEQAVRAMATCLPKNELIQTLGPVLASLSKLKGHHRWRFLIKAPKSVALQPFIKTWMGRVAVPSSIKIQVDVDPYGFY